MNSRAAWKDEILDSFMIEEELLDLLSSCPWAIKHLEPALDGDAESAFSLAVAASNGIRGALVRGFYEYGAPLNAYRALLGAVWDHDHHELIEVAEDRRKLKAMFRYAKFSLPTDMPETVRVWRGVNEFSLRDAARACRQSNRGYSWTLNRDVACWFAMRFAGEDSYPFVFAAEIPRKSIVYYTNERSEEEVVCFNSPTLKVTIDGDKDDWWQGYERYESWKHEELQKWLKEKGMNVG